MDITIEFGDLTRVMGKSLEKSAPKPTLMMSFFANKETYDTEIVELDKRFKGARVAKFVNPDAVADGTEKLSFDNYTFKLPTMQDLQTLTGKELKKRLLGENVYAAKTPAQKGAIITKEIQTEQRDMVEVAMELMAIDAVFNGQLTIVGKGENRVLSFNRKASHTIVLGSGNYWDEGTSVPDEDIETFIDLIGQAGSNATHMIGRFATMRHFVKNDVIKAELDNKRIENGEIRFKSMLDVDGSIYYGKYKGIELWGYEGNYVDSNGVEQKAVPAKKVAILSARNANSDIAGYSADVDIDFNMGGSNVKAAKDARQFISKITKGKKVIEIEAIQTRAPMLIDADSTIVATVIS